MPAPLGQLVEARHLLRRFDQPAGLRDRRGLPFAQRRLVGPAALAGAEARRSASAQVAWKATFSRRASREGQDGRQ